jgi:hypothetical protein
VKKGADPFGLEKVLSLVEADLGPILAGVLSTNQLPRGTDLEVLLNLVVVNVVRVPAFRDMLKNVIISETERSLREALSTPERWSAFLQKYPSARNTEPVNSREGMKEFLDKQLHEDDIILHPNHHFKGMLDVLPFAFNLLVARRWHLTVAGDDAPDFVCSDNPVASTPSEVPLRTSPGIEGVGVLITMPLGRRIALTSGPVGLMLPSPAPTKIVALINTATIRGASRFIYSASGDFAWRANDKRTCGAMEFLSQKIQ